MMQPPVAAASTVSLSLEERVALLESREEMLVELEKQSERFRVSFVKKALAIFLAYSLSETIYHWLIRAGLDELNARLVYAVLITFGSPACLCVLAGSDKDGSSYLASVYALLFSSAPMLLAWGNDYPPIPRRYLPTTPPSNPLTTTPTPPPNS